MKRNALSLGLSRALACAVLLPCSLSAWSQTVPQTPDGPDPAADPKELDRIVVQAEITYRNRTSDIDPTLVYDLEYFQRFEPNTVGDMLKQVPGVAFVDSDIMEYDAVALRGLGGGYTQVLINGKKVPGAEDDRSFYVDRIPAEMVDHIEIKRSASANRSGDAMAGAINIVLRDSYEFSGGYVRAGVNRWYDGEINPTFGAVVSGDALGGRVLAGINVQDRYRVKEKRSDRWSDDSREELVSWEDQTETKDGRDYSANLSYNVDVGETGRLTLEGWYVKTDRDVTEVSYSAEVDDDEAEYAVVPGLDPYDQKNYGFGLGYRFDMAGGTTKLDADFSAFENSEASTEGEAVYVGDATGFLNNTWSIDGAEWDGTEYEAEAADAKDDEVSFKLAHIRPVGDTELEFGVDYRSKKRDVTYTNYEWEADDEGQTPTWPADYALDDSDGTRIEEKRLDPYIMFSGRGDVFSWEAGLRYETTKTDISSLYTKYDDGEVELVQATANSKDYNELLPSVSLRWDLSEADRVNLSLAKTVKRPNFNELIPALLDGEYGDNDYVGNPELEQETANGFDIGFEHRLGKKGVIGINFFYRDVKNLVELVNLGFASQESLADIGDDVLDNEDFAEDFMDDYMAANPGATTLDAQAAADAALRAAVADAGGEFSPESWVYSSANVGDGKVYGAEFDLSTPLSFIGLDNTGVFLNYTWLDSKVDDFMGERRFNGQSKSTFNVGFIQDMPNFGASFGVTYHKQGDYKERVLGEEGLTTYDADLQAFVEKRFGDSLSVRLSAYNLLDAGKDEYYDKFDTLEDQLDRDYDEYEHEHEEAGPAYQLVVRWAF
ncbi:TonB-dependent receptor [Pseudoxanthomonas kalamensis DSM 18571]|uniref:TonB-dependent receptor plug domain-containing protein n=1 Tax=Pseudoxanthomonas kalamensis TaxID=289483 RepID=UPI001390EE09|nr:TonB-dependent receptor [Pseudoxanthomonas kalamensis]KAF1710331.1 TonB-dependent receptor [Pseudoxanthomonas kalamensis DSM 18571]